MADTTSAWILPYVPYDFSRTGIINTGAIPSEDCRKMFMKIMKGQRKWYTTSSGKIAWSNEHMHTIACECIRAYMADTDVHRADALEFCARAIECGFTDLPDDNPEFYAAALTLAKIKKRNFQAYYELYRKWSKFDGQFRRLYAICWMEGWPLKIDESDYSNALEVLVILYNNDPCPLAAKKIAEFLEKGHYSLDKSIVEVLVENDIFHRSISECIKIVGKTEFYDSVVDIASQKKVRLIIGC